MEGIRIGQAEVMKVLIKAKKPMSRSQIAEEINELPQRVSRILKVMLKYNDIKCIELDRYQAAKLLGWDIAFRRTRFYYV